MSMRRAQSSNDSQLSVDGTLIGLSRAGRVHVLSRVRESIAFSLRFFSQHTLGRVVISFSLSIRLLQWLCQ
jgi:hypothetical protein